MWDSVGVDWHPLKRGANADMFAGNEVFSSQQKQILQDWMNEVYEDFKGHVMQARGDRLVRPLEQMAGGRVYTGKQALELGLVDRIGTLQDAIRLAAQQAKLPAGEYAVRVIPKPQNFVEKILTELSDGDEDRDRLALPAAAAIATEPRFVAPILAQLPPHQVAALRRAWVQLQLLQREGISLMAPEFVFE
jgi:protease-4